MRTCYAGFGFALSREWLLVLGAFAAGMCLSSRTGNSPLDESRPSVDMVEPMNARVIVMPKAAVLDPQGNAVRDAMQHLGMPEVRSVRIGKYMEIDIDGQNGKLESRLHRLCRDLLSNPVIEDYELQQSEVGARTSGTRSRKMSNARRPTPNAQVQKNKRKRKRKSSR